jgi:hypothetical protein
VAYCEIAYEKDEPKAPAAVYGPLGIIFHPKEKANVIADCVENRFTSHDLCDESHERQVETRFQTLLASVDDTPLGKVRPSDIHKLSKSLKLRKVCGLDGIPNECLRHLPRRPLIHLSYLITAFGRPIFQSLGRKQIYKVTEPK